MFRVKTFGSFKPNSTDLDLNRKLGIIVLDQLQIRLGAFRACHLSTSRKRNVRKRGLDQCFGAEHCLDSRPLSLPQASGYCFLLAIDFELGYFVHLAGACQCFALDLDFARQRVGQDRFAFHLDLERRAWNVFVLVGDRQSVCACEPETTVRDCW